MEISPQSTYTQKGAIPLLPSRQPRLLIAMGSSSRLVLWGLGVSSFATSFSHHHCTSSSLRSGTRSSSPASAGATSTRHPCHRYRCPALRLAQQQEQRDKDGTTGSSSSVSEFEQTSGPVKAFVGGLTDLFVSFSGGGNTDATAISVESPKVSVAPQEFVPILGVYTSAAFAS